MHFPAMARAYGGAGAALMAVPAWDFTVDGWMAERMSLLRGVEGGFAMARSAREGRLSLSDSRGAVLAESASGPGVSLVQASLKVPDAAEPTFYARFGDCFGWAALGLAVILILRSRGLLQAPPGRP
jgi:apolipoprotein N-acyltransferase